MKFRIGDCVQREHYFAIVDEVDSILIDEARTPLIISGPSEESTDKYYKINRIIPSLIRGEVIEGKEPGQKWTTGDYTVDEKHRSVGAHRRGRRSRWRSCWAWAIMYDADQHGDQSSRAAGASRPTCCSMRDRDYVVKDDEVIIVDEFTGRLMPGRRWSRRSAPGRRSQGRRQDPARKSDAGHHHLPELLPHVQEAGRHDRYGRNGSRRVREDLQARRHHHPHQPAAAAQRVSGRRLPHRRREVPQRRQGDQGAARKGPAGAGGHRLGREIGEVVRNSEEAWASATRS